MRDQFGIGGDELGADDARSDDRLAEAERGPVIGKLVTRELLQDAAAQKADDVGERRRGLDVEPGGIGLVPDVDPVSRHTALDRRRHARFHLGRDPRIEQRVAVAEAEAISALGRQYPDHRQGLQRPRRVDAER